MQITALGIRAVGSAVVLTGLTFWLAYNAFANTIVRVVATKSPVIALDFDKEDSTALVAHADSLATNATSTRDILQIRHTSRLSLNSQALNPRALRQLATFDGISERSASSAERLADLSVKLSRRETGAQILKIEQLATTDNIFSVLQHYDVALTVDLQSKEQLFPILASAIEDPAINTQFAPYLSLNRPWMPLFVRYKFDNDMTSTALETAALDRRVRPVAGDFSRYVQYVFGRAIKMNRIEQAMLLFLKYQIADPATLTSSAISLAPENGRSQVVAWNLFQYPEIASEIWYNDTIDRYGLRISATSGGYGVVASKMLLLVPGRYLVNIVYGDVTLATGTVATWRIKCANMTGEPIIWHSTDALPQPGERFTQSVNIPARCSAQSLELFVIAANGIQENLLDVTKIDIISDR